MKNLKSKLLASIAMLLVSTVMLTSASFAWFTISTAPEIKGISAKATANGNLEIALSDGTDGAPEESSVTDGTNVNKNETWGNLVDLSSYSTVVTLRPVEVVATASESDAVGDVKAPTWGTDGRIVSYNKITATKVDQNNLHGLYTYTANGDICAIRVDFWLRSNVDGTITLSGEANRVEGDNSTAGSGSFLKSTGTPALPEELNDKVKVAFKGDSGLVVATRNATTGALTSGTICTLKADEAEMVSMYLYMDGTLITNQHLQNALTDLTLSVQFAHSATLVAMDTTLSAGT